MIFCWLLPDTTGWVFPPEPELDTSNPYLYNCRSKLKSIDLTVSMKRKLVLLLIFIIACSFPAKTDQVSRENYVTRAVKSARPSVVNISTEEIVRYRNRQHKRDPFGFFDDFSEPKRKYEHKSLGSGVIIDEKGYILTNRHVIRKASRIKVILSDNSEYTAKTVGSDSDLDLAVLKIESDKSLPVINIGTSNDLMIGEDVIAIGNPFGLSHTVTKGVISSVSRSVKTEERVYSNFIQTDAAINPGNSGGPLLNIKGEMIGVNSAIYRQAEGIGFAIPVDRAMRVAKDMIKYGEVQQGWLGLKVQTVDERIAGWLGLKRPKGVLVSEVIKGGPADKGNIQRADAILRIKNTVLKDESDYYGMIRGFAVGERISLEILRDGKKREVELNIRSFSFKNAHRICRRDLGLIFPEKKSFFRKKTEEGIVPKKIKAGSPADQIGLKTGDRIVSINGYRLVDTSSFKQAMLEAFMKRKAVIDIRRGGYLYRVPVNLK